MHQLLDTNHIDIIQYVNALLKKYKSNELNETHRLPTRQKPGDQTQRTPIQKRILQDLIALHKLEQLNVQEHQAPRDQVLSSFNWAASKLANKPCQAFEERWIRWMKKSTTYSQGIDLASETKMTSNWNWHLTMRSQPMVGTHKHQSTWKMNRTADLPHYANSALIAPYQWANTQDLFAQRQPNGTLRLFVELQKKSTSWLQTTTYNNDNPVSTLTDAAQHTQLQRFSCKLNCSQLYHCLQMADQRSVEMLALNFASRTLTYRRPAQGLRTWISAFSSFLRDHWDLVN